MCGRFTIGNQAAIEREFSIIQPLWTFQASYNVAPTHSIPVVRTQDGRRTGVMMRWGLIPWFAKGTPPNYSTIYVAVAHMFR